MIAQADVLRPGPVRWLWYTFGGGLGPRYRGWVLRDITSRTRWVRQVVRTLVQVAPVAALLIVVFGFSWITWVSLIGGLLLALLYAIPFFDRFAEYRLSQHGYPSGTAQRAASERARVKDPDRIRRYMLTYRNGAGAT